MNLFTKKRAGISAILLSAVALVSLAGCGSDKKDDASASHNSQDVSFAKDMIPHHAQAVEMSKLAPTRAQNARVKTLAQQIEAAQQPEINTMNGFLTKWGEPTVDPSASMGEHAGHGATMPGMMSADDMKKLEAASGSAFDRMFMEMMIEHHKGAIEMSKKETEKGKDTEAKNLATTITTAQQAEITEMENLLKQI
jgi:uncharacterized protein (DUF305 family)